MHISRKLYNIVSVVLSQFDNLATSNASTYDKICSVSEITLDVGGSTGWHYHGADVHVYVHSGTLTQVYAGRIRRRIFHAGDRFVEKGGPDNVHESRNDGREPVVLHALHVSRPDGTVGKKLTSSP